MAEWWDRNGYPGVKDSRKAYAGFCGYRDMGAGRGLRALHERYIQLASSGEATPPTTKWWTLCNWSERNEWVRRSHAWDAHLEEQSRIDQLGQIQDMNTRHIDLARAVQVHIAKRLREGIAQIPISEMGWHELIRAMVESTKLERLARGEPGDIVDMRIIRREAERIAEKHGVPVEDVLAQAEAIAKGEWEREQ